LAFPPINAAVDGTPEPDTLSGVPEKQRHALDHYAEMLNFYPKAEAVAVPRRKQPLMLMRREAGLKDDDPVVSA